MDLSPRLGLLLAPVLALALTIPAGASGPTTGLSRATSQQRVPDWLAEYDDESSEPLSFDQLTQALRQSVEGPELYGLRVTSTPHYAGDRGFWPR